MHRFLESETLGDLFLPFFSFVITSFIFKHIYVKVCNWFIILIFSNDFIKARVISWYLTIWNDISIQKITQEYFVKTELNAWNTKIWFTNYNIIVEHVHFLKILLQKSTHGNPHKKHFYNSKIFTTIEIII